MRIEFRNSDNAKKRFKFLNEVSGIDSFRKKYLTNPYKKPVPILTEYISVSIYLLIFIFLFLVLYLNNNTIINLIFLIIIILLFELFLIAYFFMRLHLKISSKEHIDSFIDVDEDKIVYSSKKNNCLTLITIYWDNIEYVLINKRSIFFLTKTKELSCFSCSIDYKDKIIKMIDKYDKCDLVVDNTKR